MTTTALYLVLVANGVISGTWGPLPYGLDECQVRAAEFLEMADDHEETASWTIACEYHAERPKLGEAPE